MKNIIKNLLTPAERAELVSLISRIETILHGKLAGLTASERSLYGSINEKNKLLVNKVRDYREHSPELSSPDVDWDEFESDYQSRGFLESYQNRLDSLSYGVESTKILHDYDNYQDSLKEHAHARYKKISGVSGYTEKVADLKQFFNRTGTGGRNKEKDEDKTS